MSRNKLAPPDSKAVEDCGHKLRSLLDATKAVCATHGVTAGDAFQADSSSIVILGFLDDFAHPGGRYFNINKVTANRHQACGRSHRAVGRNCQPDHASAGHAEGAPTCSIEWADGKALQVGVEGGGLGGHGRLRVD